jgi:hypothetical protein
VGYRVGDYLVILERLRGGPLGSPPGCPSRGCTGAPPGGPPAVPKGFWDDSDPILGRFCVDVRTMFGRYSVDFLSILAVSFAFPFQVDLLKLIHGCFKGRAATAEAAADL